MYLETTSFTDVLARGDSWSHEIRNNVHYYQNKVVRIENTDFILSTLWSHITPRDEYFVSRGMNDFRQIQYGGRRFTTEDYNVKKLSETTYDSNVITKHDSNSYIVDVAIEDTTAPGITMDGSNDANSIEYSNAETICRLEIDNDIQAKDILLKCYELTKDVGSGASVVTTYNFKDNNVKHDASYAEQAYPPPERTQMHRPAPDAGPEGTHTVPGILPLPHRAIR